MDKRREGMSEVKIIINGEEYTAEEIEIKKGRLLPTNSELESPKFREEVGHEHEWLLTGEKKGYYVINEKRREGFLEENKNEFYFTKPFYREKVDIIAQELAREFKGFKYKFICVECGITKWVKEKE